MNQPILSLLIVAGLLTGRSSAEDAPPPEQIEFFESHVRPLLVERCHDCHGLEEQEAGLRLDSRSMILKGGETGPAVVPGQPEQSELIRAIRYAPDGYQMPPDGKLTEKQIATLTRWVEMGAPWPHEAPITAGTQEAFDLDERAERWSFQPLRRPALPRIATNDSAWCRNPIDRFLLARLKAAGLSPAPAADRATLLRRVWFDVIGLPPTPKVAREFVSEAAPDAFERMVEQLLCSPHFGERWGRHWLDLVRYAESRGHEFDYDVANAYQYRDFVIRALNDDVPYDQFVIEHVAGDLLTSETEHPIRLHPQTGANESILGTGFWFLGEWVHSPVDIRADEAERFANMIDVYSKTFLGLTVACARCHDHKFDPITTKDFYALQGYLQSSHYRQARFETMEDNRRVARQLSALNSRATPALATMYFDVVTDSLADLASYLHAAYVVIQQSGAQTDDTADGNHVGQLVDERNLQAPRLRAWIDHLRLAKLDDKDPFHYWGRLASGEIADVVALEQIILTDLDRGHTDEDNDDPLPAEVEHNTQAGIGGTSGEITFDVAPTRRPVIRLQESVIRPVADFSETRTTWSIDPAFSNLGVHPSVAPEPGGTGNWRSAGRTLRSGSFEITQDKVCFRIRGGCNTHVVVDSHVLIKGPLHGSLLKEHPTPAEGGDKWRWVEHEVTRYRGHRAHVEIVRRAGEDFSIDQIVHYRQPDGDRTQPSSLALATFDSLSAWHTATDEGPGQPAPAMTPESLARFLQEKILQEFVAMRTWYLNEEGSHDQFPDVRLLEWVVGHDELFGLNDPPARKVLEEVAAPYRQLRAQLVNQVQNISQTAPAMVDVSPEDEYVFIRGNWKKRGDTVPRRILEVFAGTQMPRPADGSGRRELAEWMVDHDKTPILPRVIVNRIWQHYFGAGIVPTPDDFGHMGQNPSHPELLDWLASELVEHNWSLKHIHRLILTSAAYRMASTTDSRSSMVGERRSTPESDNHRSSTIDPGNRLLHRMNIKRLEGEILRDAILSLSGRIDKQLSGPSVPVFLTPFMEGRGRPQDSGPLDGAGRRSLYIAVRRNFPDPFFQAFDMPNPHTTVGRRNVSNVPAQALALLNNPFVADQARLWGQQLATIPSDSGPDERIRSAYLACLSRSPTQTEARVARAFMEQQAGERQLDVDDPQVWCDFCHVLLNTKEFLFVR